MERFFCLLFMLSAVLPSTRLVSVVGTAPNFSELEKVALAELAETGIPGAAIAVISGDSLVFAKGFGVASVETGAPVTPDTLFQIGSMTKTFTAAALVALAEAGKLKLDQPISSYVTGLSPKLARVTTHQLLSHTAGLKDEPDEYGLHEEAALATYVRSWQDDYCLFAPGQVFSYSNAGLALAGFVLQEVGGKSYAELMHERLFQPLSMQRTTFRPTVAMTYPLALGHRARGNEKPVVVRPMADDARLWPAGNLYASANDLARFALAFLNEGRIDGKQVLSPSVIAKLATPSAEIPSFAETTHYGYGLFLDQYRGTPQAWHDGSMPGFLGMLRMVPRHRFAVIVLTNKDGGRLKKTMEKAMELLLPLPPKTEPKSKPALSLSEAEIQRYIGEYAQPNRWTASVFSKDGKLWLKQFGSEAPLTSIGEHRFSFQLPNEPRGEEIVFGLGADGAPLYLHQFVWAFKKAPSNR